MTQQKGRSSAGQDAMYQVAIFEMVDSVTARFYKSGLEGDVADCLEYADEFNLCEIVREKGYWAMVRKVVRAA